VPASIVSASAAMKSALCVGSVAKASSRSQASASEPALSGARASSAGELMTEWYSVGPPLLPIARQVLRKRQP
jgi:hypothetical protein